jgi:predicted nucleic acid-binding protein
MNGNNYLLDTNIVLYLLGGDKILAEILGNKTPFVSYISEMELLGSPKINTAEEKQIKNFLSVCNIIEMNQDIKHLAIQIRKKSGLKLPDSIIAATAEHAALLLLTADAEFNKLRSLNIVQYKK